MCTPGESNRFDDLEEDGLIANLASIKCSPLKSPPSTDVAYNSSSTDVTERLSSADVTNSPNTPKQNDVDEKVIKSLRRVDTQISDELDTKPTSEIFVRHQWEDTIQGDGLGGFLCSTTLKDGTNLHAFCSLDANGILAKSLHVKEKDILVSLNSAQLLDPPSISTEDVLELFRTLPIGEPINMVIYSRKTKLFTFIDFQLEAIKKVMLKTAYVKLTSSGHFPPTVKALRIPNQPKFLVFDEGRLQCSQINDFLRDCRCHFIVKKSLNEDTWRFEYRYQVQKDTSKYLGIKGNTLDLMDESDKELTLFQQEERNGLVLLKLSRRNDMTVSFNEDRGVYEVRPHCFDLKPEHGINMVRTNCPV
ncbi:uncharacterized protein LOC133192807 isoform X2 [Saccostrea echinata]|uniref:uncharacterized protein LOC133192807 isoform X2 n=1 Tax=Saccostrea echinata TaxID=191078 RepID=UPI002A81184A|nr:uncharacterized protein LOC133192807 isoform X2 [Saccostrea echinata]